MAKNPSLLIPTEVAAEQSKLKPTRLNFVPPILMQGNGIPMVPPCAGQFVIAGDVVKVQTPGGPAAGTQPMMPVWAILNDLGQGTSKQSLCDQSGWLTIQDCDDCIAWFGRMVALVFPNVGTPKLVMDEA